MKKLYGILLAFIISFLLLGCEQTNSTENEEKLIFKTEDNITIKVGQSLFLDVENNTGLTDPIVYSAENDCVSVNQLGMVYGLKPGSSYIYARVGKYNAELMVNVAEKGLEISLTIDKSVLEVGEQIKLNLFVSPASRKQDVVYEIKVGEDICHIDNDILYADSYGEVSLCARIDNVFSNYISLKIRKPAEPDITTDPYVNVSEREFYSNYTPASCYKDAYYRTMHHFMSGSIEPQDQAPTIASYQPMSGSTYIRNTQPFYSADENTFYVVDGYGEVVNKIYRGGAYVTLEEVAAYVLAFGEVPSNYVKSTKAKPSKSPWKKYLRCNNNEFSGSTDRYRFEPELPDISGCGGYTDYNEIDIGTTGTDCDPKFPSRIYNDGKSITRGAARIVYTPCDRNNFEIKEINKRYVFYTYNHYNDFQEYLNYEGGWGEMFGNITGGGRLSDNGHAHPTPYIPTLRQNFKKTSKSYSDINCCNSLFVGFNYDFLSAY